MKNFKIFSMAAIAAMICASCAEGDNTGTKTEDGKSSLVVKLAGVKPAPETRAVEDAGTQTLLAVDKGYIFVIDAAGNVAYGEALDIDKASDEGQVLSEDSVNPKLVSSDSRVYILGNYPSDVTPADLKTWAQIQAKTSTFTINTDYKLAAVANSTGALALIEPTTAGKAEVEIDLSPLYSRLELHKVVGGEHVTAFTVAGVYVDEYHAAFTMTGAKSGPMWEQEMSKVFTQATTDKMGNAGTWAADGVAGAKTAVPASGKVWAYHMAAGSTPRFIIHLSSVTYEYETVEGSNDYDGTAIINEDRYITVSGYSETLTNGFQRGKIYRVGGTDGITFNPGDLALTPNPEDVELTVFVEVLQWGFETLTPNL